MNKRLPSPSSLDQLVASRGQRILFLQGHPSRLWGELSDKLQAEGASVHKINFCLADVIFWGRRDSVSYRGRFSKWQSWLDDYVRRHQITDIVYYADRFPYHVVAREVGEALGVRCWVIEFGYLRPDWITFERGGMGQYSQFDRSPIGMRRLARDAEALPDMTPRYTHSFAKEAMNEVAFGLLSAFGRPLFPVYKSDRRYGPIVDYLSWIPKLLTSRRSARAAEHVEARLYREKPHYFLVPLQIEADYQIRDNSPYESLEQFIFEVMRSFARHAPADTRLVVKLHPLDSGLENWRSRCVSLARRFGLEDRVDILRGGDLHALLACARGTVLVNSTVGLHALRQHVPVHACGSAIYDLPGLTHQGPLSDFWVRPPKVDPTILDTFLRALTTIQVKGSFFLPTGRKAAVEAIAERLTAVPSFDHRASAKRLRWRIKSPPPIANKNAPASKGKPITTYSPS